MGKNGGHRPGAGRPKGTKMPQTVAKEMAREYLRQQVIASLKVMTAAQIEAATGAMQFVYRDKDGRFKVIDDPDELRKKTQDGTAISLFTRLPSTPAYTDLMNRALDKPTEGVQQQVSGTLEIRWKNETP